MTKEDEKVLLEDLGARMIHGVIVNTPKGDGYLGTINLTIFGHELDVNVKATKRENFPLDECKPYLRPMSSMTEEEKKELNNVLEYQYYSDDSCMCESTDWLNAHYLDYRGLIDKGLALEAPEGMYNIN